LFTNIPKHFAPASRNGADVTRFNLDKSRLLDHILVQGKLVDSNGKPKPRLLLGEMQFAFVSFLMGHLFDAFEQWKSILALLCSCEGALKTYPEFFLDYIDALHHQLGEIPEDFFIDILSGKNFLTSTLTGFFDILDDVSNKRELRDAGQNLRRFVERRFGRSFSVMDLDAVDDEDAPTVVDM
jgi:A1 cistron-splicing factor AAR2